MRSFLLLLVGLSASAFGRGWVFVKSPAASFSNTKSISLDGSTQYVDMGSGASLNPNLKTTAASAGGWIYATNALGSLSSNIIFSNAEASGATNRYKGLMFLLNGVNGLDLGLYMVHDYNAADRMAVYAAFTFSANTWYHVAFTTDGTGSAAGTKLYINGVSQTVITTFDSLSGTTVSANNMYLGAPNAGSFGNKFQGQIDEPFYINGTALTAGQIAAIYNSGVPVSLASYSPTSWWRFENVLTDTQGTNNGTGVGSPTYSTNVP